VSFSSKASGRKNRNNVEFCLIGWCANQPYLFNNISLIFLAPLIKAVFDIFFVYFDRKFNSIGP
jgi:hypothetical protein